MFLKLWLEGVHILFSQYSYVVKSTVSIFVLLYSFESNKTRLKQNEWRVSYIYVMYKPSLSMKVKFFFLLSKHTCTRIKHCKICTYWCTFNLSLQALVTDVVLLPPNTQPAIVWKWIEHYSNQYYNSWIHQKEQTSQ